MELNGTVISIAENIDLLIKRIEAMQTGPLNCREHEQSLYHLQEAKRWHIEAAKRLLGAAA